MTPASRIAVWSVAGGLVLNIGVAWAAVIFSPVEATASDPVPSRQQEIWRRTAPASFPERAGALVDKRFTGFRARVFQGEGDPGCELRIYEVGFPLASLRGIKSEVNWGPRHRWVEFRQSIDPALVPVVPDVRVLPLAPMWPGFLVDTIFFGSVLALLATSWRHLRRSVRRRHDQCPTCAYPTRGAAICTECGEPIA